MGGYRELTIDQAKRPWDNYSIIYHGFNIDGEIQDPASKEWYIVMTEYSCGDTGSIGLFIKADALDALIDTLECFKSTDGFTKDSAEIECVRKVESLKEQQANLADAIERGEPVSEMDDHHREFLSGHILKMFILKDIEYCREWEMTDNMMIELGIMEAPVPEPEILTEPSTNGLFDRLKRCFGS